LGLWSRISKKSAVMDRFGESGKPEELLEAYGLDAVHIIAAAKKAVTRN